MKILSLFDWMACGYEALVRAWIPIDKYYASEIDKYAIQIATKNHPDIIEIWDVCNVKWEDYQDIDLLIWGSPCQWFSVAGKMLNFDDPRSKLFFEYVRLLREVKPKYFLLENVKMKKEWQDIISRELWVEPIEINSSLVSAQSRRRLYRTNIPSITQPTDKGILLKDILEDNVDEKYYYSAERWNRILAWKYDIVKRLEEVSKKCNTLTTVWGGNHEKKIAVSHCPQTKEFQWQWFSLEKSPTLLARDYKDPKVAVDLISVSNWEVRVRQATKQWYIVANDGDGISLSSDNPSPSSSWVWIWKANTLTTEWESHVLKDKQIRKLTPIEYERLQTLPDNYTEWVSDTQRYKMLGNGWTVDVISHIFSFIPKEWWHTEN